MFDRLGYAELRGLIALCARLDAGETMQDLPESERLFLKQLEAMGAPVEW